MFVIKSNEMKKIEQYMIETVGVSSLILMENAAKAVVDVIVAQFPDGAKQQQSIVILCGTGNNGGDGLCIAKWLVHKGYKVDTFLIGQRDKCSQETQKQAVILDKLIQPITNATLTIVEKSDHISDLEQLDTSMQNAVLIVDSLIGTGCHRTLSDQMVRIVNHINKAQAKVISVDVPTGINSDNGKVMGTAVKATTTVTFCLPKLGHVLHPGMNYCGNLIVTDIGIFEHALGTIENPITLINRDLFLEYERRGLFQRETFSHKGTFGTLGIIAGDKHMLGATILAAKAAYKSGVGLVKIFVHEDNAELILSAVNECVVVTYDDNVTKEELDESIDNFFKQISAILIGPGLSKSLRAKHFVQKVINAPIKAIMDADALNILSEQLELLEECQCELIITPHIGEMSRLTGYCSSGIIENLLPFAEAFSEKYAITTILKSARTVIVTKALKRYINLLGNSGMATAGSGDVLAGVVAGLFAQGYSNEYSGVIGTMLHSLAGEVYAKSYGEHSLTATDLINYLWRSA